jgi:hypothetical protein
MSISILTFADGDTDYVFRLNANFANLKTGVEAIDALLASQIQGGSGNGATNAALFGATNSLIGAGAYLPSGSGETLTVAAGSAWVPSLGLVVTKGTSTPLSFTGQPSDTYYVDVDATGALSRSDTLGAASLYSVVWDGADFGTITQLAASAFGAQDAELLALAGLTSAANKIPMFSGSGTATLLTLDTDGTLAANSDTTLASQKAVKTAIATAIADLIGTAPGVLDTLGEISDAINDDANLYTTLATSIALKAPLASPALTGNPTAPTQSAGDNSTKIATTAYADAAIAAGQAGTLAQFAATTSAQLAGVISDETGSGALVFGTSPTLVTPALGTPSALVLTNATGLPVAGGGTGVATLTAYAPIFGGTTGTGAVQSGTAGTAYQVMASNGAGALPTFQDWPPIFALFFGGKPTNSELLFKHSFRRQMKLVASLTGSAFSIDTNPTATHTFTINKNGASVGTVAFSTSGVPTVTFASDVTFAVDDLMTITAQASADATGADITFSLKFELV